MTQTFTKQCPSPGEPDAAKTPPRISGQGLVGAMIFRIPVRQRNRNGTGTVIKCQVPIVLAGFHHLSRTSQSWPQKLQLQPPSLFVWRGLSLTRCPPALFIGAFFGKKSSESFRQRETSGHMIRSSGAKMTEWGCANVGQFNHKSVALEETRGSAASAAG